MALELNYFIRTKRKEEHPWADEGFIVGYTVNGVEGDELFLDYDSEYTFHINAPTHPFYFSSSETGDNSFEAAIFPRADTAKRRGVEVGTLKFKPSRDLPDDLKTKVRKTYGLDFFYQCGIHPRMGGPVHIIVAEHPTEIGKPPSSFSTAAASDRISLQPVMKATAPVALLPHPNDSTAVAVIEQTGRLWGVHIVPQKSEIRESDCAWIALDLRSQIQRLNLNKRYDERGFLGFAFHPKFGRGDNRGFLYYSIANEDASKALDHKSCISEITFNMSSNECGTRFIADMRTERVLFDIDQYYYNHNGGNLLFHPEREPAQLHIFSGDGGSQGDPDNRAQNSFDLHGKELCVVVDDVPAGSRYAVPADNPYADGVEGDPRVRSLGWRNPWGASFELTNSDNIWIADVGESSQEEINVIGGSGGNYGWSVYEGTLLRNPGRFDSTADYTFPLYSYEHVSEGAVIGGYHLDENNYLFGDYSGLLMLLSRNDSDAQETTNWKLSHQQKFPEAVRLRAFGRDGYGRMYALTTPTDGLTEGTIYRLEFNGASILPSTAHMKHLVSFKEFMRKTAMLASIYIRKLATGADMKVLAATEIALNATAEAVEDSDWKSILIFNNNALKDMILGVVGSNTARTEAAIESLKISSDRVATAFTADDPIAQELGPKESMFYSPVRALWLKYINCIRVYAELGKQVKAGNASVDVLNDKTCVKTAETVGAHLDITAQLALKASRGPWSWLKRNIFRPIKEKVGKAARWIKEKFTRKKKTATEVFIKLEIFEELTKRVIGYAEAPRLSSGTELLNMIDIYPGRTGWSLFIIAIQQRIYQKSQHKTPQKTIVVEELAGASSNVKKAKELLEQYTLALDTYLFDIDNKKKKNTFKTETAEIGEELEKLSLKQSSSAAVLRPKTGGFVISIIDGFPIFESLLLQNISYLFDYIVALMTTGATSELTQAASERLLNQGNQLDDTIWMSIIDSFNRYIQTIVSAVLNKNEEAAALTQSDIDSTIRSAALQFGPKDSDDYVRASMLFQLYFDCIRTYCESLAYGDKAVLEDPLILLQLNTCIQIAQDAGQRLDILAHRIRMPAIEPVLNSPYRDLFYDYGQALTAYARLVYSTGKPKFKSGEAYVDRPINTIRAKNKQLGAALDTYTDLLLQFTDRAAIKNGATGTTESAELNAAYQRLLSVLECILGLRTFAESLLRLQRQHYYKFLDGLVGIHSEITTLKEEALCVASSADIGSAIDFSMESHSSASPPSPMKMLPSNVIEELKQRQIMQSELRDTTQPPTRETLKKLQEERPTPSPPLPRVSRESKTFERLNKEFAESIIRYGEALKTDNLDDQKKIMNNIINAARQDWAKSVLGHRWATLMQRFVLLLINMMNNRLAKDENKASENMFRLFSLSTSVINYFASTWNLTRNVFFPAWTHYSECMSTLTATLANQSLDSTVYKRSKQQCLLDAAYFGRLLDIQFSAITGKPLSMSVQDLQRLKEIASCAHYEPSEGLRNWIKRKAGQLKEGLKQELTDTPTTTKIHVFESALERLNTKAGNYIKALVNKKSIDIRRDDLIKVKEDLKNVNGWSIFIGSLPEYLKKASEQGQDAPLPQQLFFFTRSFQRQSGKAQKVIEDYLKCLAAEAEKSAPKPSECLNLAEKAGKRLDELAKKTKLVLVSKSAALCEEYRPVCVYEGGIPDFKLFLKENYFLVFDYVYAYYNSDEADPAAAATQLLRQSEDMVNGQLSDAWAELLIQHANGLKAVIDALLKADEESVATTSAKLDAVIESIAKQFGPVDSEAYVDAGLQWSRYVSCVKDYVRSAVTTKSAAYQYLHVNNCIVVAEAVGTRLLQLLSLEAPDMLSSTVKPCEGIDDFYYMYANVLVSYAEAVNRGNSGTAFQTYGPALKEITDKIAATGRRNLADALADYTSQLLLLVDEAAPIGSGGVSGMKAEAIRTSDAYSLTRQQYMKAVESDIFLSQERHYYDYLDALAGLHSSIFASQKRRQFIAASIKLGKKHLEESETRPVSAVGPPDLQQELRRRLAARNGSRRSDVCIPVARRKGKPKMKPRAKTMPVEQVMKRKVTFKDMMKQFTESLIDYAESLKTDNTEKQKLAIQSVVDTVNLHFALSVLGPKWAAIMHRFAIIMVNTFLLWLNNPEKERRSSLQLQALLQVTNEVEIFFNSIGRPVIEFFLPWTDYYTCMYQYASELSKTQTLGNKNYLFKKRMCLDNSTEFGKTLDRANFSRKRFPSNAIPKQTAMTAYRNTKEDLLKHSNFFVLYVKSMDAARGDGDINIARKLSEHVEAMHSRCAILTIALGIVMTECAELAVALTQQDSEKVKTLSASIQDKTKRTVDKLRQAGVSDNMIIHFLLYTQSMVDYVRHKDDILEGNYRKAALTMGDQANKELIVLSPAAAATARGKSFEDLMVDHINLTIAYGEAAFRYGVNSSEAAAAAKKLLAQIEEWPLDRKWKQLLREHTVSAKKLIDAVFQRNETAKKDALGELGRNMTAVVDYLANATKGDTKILRLHWDAHLKCTLNYTEKLEAGGRSSRNYQDATKTCIKKGRGFGLYLDMLTSSSSPQ